MKVAGHGGFRRRIVEMGFVKGKTVEALQRAPLGDPTEYEVMGYKVSLRNSEAERIEVISQAEARREAEEEQRARGGRQAGEPLTVTDEDIIETALRHRREIQVALVGNPNAGKTSLFNVISGLREKVGNYSGVTVDAKETLVDYKGYKIKLVDLPGTYSLSAFSPEERYVRQQIIHGRPDVIVNVIDSGNLERNLFLTTQLLDMNVRMVAALNMYDELEKKGDLFDHKSLGEMIGVPMVPTVSTQMKGITELFDTVIKLYEGEMEGVRHVHINYGAEIEGKITKVKEALTASGVTFEDYTARYMAIRMLAGDKEVEEYVAAKASGNACLSVIDECVRELTLEFKENPDNVIQDAKYGFISGALKETYKARERKGGRTVTERIDDIVTSKVWGYPIFLAAIYLMFQATFILGEYPMRGIDWCVDWFAGWIDGLMPAGVLNDLITDGIIQGVGGVLVFLPNILILYFFINLMEASGYMARAAFIMDKVMHHIGLHGRSFIPLIMGFGCNVPAIMATRTIENKNARMVTILIIPLMACSARLPIFLLMAGTFFDARYAGTVLFGMYIIGVLLAGVMAKIFKRFLFSKEEVPFVMELPPYRFPTMKMLARDTWDKCEQYLKKIGTTILVGSIIIWALSYFPEHEAGMLDNSFLAILSQAVQPVVGLLGFDWKMTASLISGVAAKEIVVSTMGILYQGGLPSWDMATVVSFMLFVLIYMPCIATIGAIRMETKSWWWALFAAFYTIVLAWIVSAVVYQSIANGVWQEVIAGGVIVWAIFRVLFRVFKRRKQHAACDGCSGNCRNCNKV